MEAVKSTLEITLIENVFFLVVYPGTESFEVVILNNQISTQVAEADLGRQRPLLLFLCIKF